MAKKALNALPQVGSVNALPAADISSTAVASSGGELQQIQDLLFGSQAREIDSNLLALEHRFNERLEKMCQTYEAKIQELNSVIAAQAAAETAARLEGYSALATEIDSVRTNADRVSASLSEQQEQAKKSSKNNLDSAMIRLEAQWQQTSSHLTSEVRQKHSALDESKVSKKALAQMLSQLATEIE